MKRVAKLVLVDSKNEYLLLRRNNHPTFGNDPDLPGGTAEDGEVSIDTLLREVKEETGIVISEEAIRESYESSAYSAHGSHFSLFFASVVDKPDITLSDEHSSYEWLKLDDFLQQAKNADDSFMHMVYDALL